MTKILKSSLILLCLAIGFGGQAQASEKSFLDEVTSSNKKFDNRAVAVDKQVIQESVLAKEENQDGPFRVLTRKKLIGRYKCSSCHTQKPVTVNQGLELTHSDIAIEHGREGQALRCIDCHHQEERNFLEDKKGRKIVSVHRDFNHPFKKSVRS